MIMHLGTSGITSLSAFLKQDLPAANEEIGEQLISALARSIVSSSSRTDLELVRENFLCIRSSAAQLESLDTVGFFESRSTRVDIISHSAQVTLAADFFSSLIGQMERDTFGLYSAPGYISAGEGRANLVLEPILFDTPDLLGIIRKHTSSEIAARRYTGHWLHSFRHQLPERIFQQMYPDGDEAPDVEDHDQESNGLSNLSAPPDNEDLDFIPALPAPGPCSLLVASAIPEVSDVMNSCSDEGSEGEASSPPPSSPTSLAPSVGACSTYSETWRRQPMHQKRRRDPSRQALEAMDTMDRLRSYSTDSSTGGGGGQKQP